MFRLRHEETERAMLSEYASLACESKGRINSELECEFRTAYQRDRDRITHSKAFRRLKYKTQVFISPEGDHYRTRLTHTLEVSQIARTVARALRLNEDLTEAIALGHDLGHTPFGHAGESALDEVHPGGFRHNAQSLRVIDFLETRSPLYDGLNLTWEVRDGIVNHTTSCETPKTLEGQIVRFADRIAYISHDIDDALRAGVLTDADLPGDCQCILGRTASQRIDTMVKNLILSSLDRPEIAMSPDIYLSMVELRRFLFDRVYVGSKAKVEEHKAVSVVKEMYRLFTQNPSLLEADIGRNIAKESIALSACDYIAGMTDRYITNCYIRHFVPHSWSSLPELP